MEEVLQTVDRTNAVDAGGRKRVCIADPGKGQRTVIISVFAVCAAFIEQIWRDEPFIIDDRAF